MKFSKDECDREVSETHALMLSDEKCKGCEYYYSCPYMCEALNDVVEGDSW